MISLLEIIKKIPLTSKEKLGYKFINGTDISLKEILDYMYPRIHNNTSFIKHYYELPFTNFLKENNVDLTAYHLIFFHIGPHYNRIQEKFKDLLGKEQYKENITGNIRLRTFKIENYILYAIIKFYKESKVTYNPKNENIDFFVKKLDSLTEIVKKIPLTSKEKLSKDIMFAKDDNEKLGIIYDFQKKKKTVVHI